MEGGVVHAVAVYFPDVEVVVNFCGVGGWDVVCGAPDAGCGGVVVGELLSLLVMEVCTDRERRMYGVI
jgi:hypothetical protein